MQVKGSALLDVVHYKYLEYPKQRHGMSDYYLLSNQYRKLDLYHLLVLKTLLDECSVSRTAEKLSVSQPAISKSLAKLREVLEDELFERGKGQLIPTARALSLNDKLERIFDQVNDVVNPEPFDPSSYKTEISLAIIEPLQPLLLPPLMTELASEAPGLSLKILNLAEGYQRHGEGRADFIMSWDHLQRDQEQLVPHYLRQPILADSTLLGLVRARHPLADTGISLETYIEQTHLVPRLSVPVLDLGQILLVALEQRDQVRKVILSCSQQGVLIDVLKRTDHMVALPGSIVRGLARQDPELGVVDLMQVSRSLDLPGLSYYLLTHQRIQNSPIHRWMQQKQIRLMSMQLGG